MEIPGLTLGPTTTGLTATPTLSLIRGDIARLPVGDLLSATLVAPLQGNQAQLRTAGTELTVRLPFPVAPDSALLLRAVPPIVPNGKPALQFLGEVFTRPQGTNPTLPEPALPRTSGPIPNPATIPNLPTATTTVSPGLPVPAGLPTPPGLPAPIGQPLPSALPGRPEVPAREQPNQRPIPPNFIPATVRQDASGKLQLEVGKTLIPIRTDQLQPGQQVLIRLPGPGPRTPFPLAGATTTGGAAAADEADAPDPTLPRTRTAADSTGTSQPKPVTADRGVVTRLLDLAQGIPARTPVPAQPALVVAEGVRPPTADGRQTVQIAGREVTLPTAEPIPVGARTLVQIESTPEGVTLRPLPPNNVPPTRIAEAVLNALPQRPEVGPTLQALVKSLGDLPAANATPEVAQLKTLLAELIPSRNEAPTAAQLAKIVREGGLQYETRLAKLPEDAPRDQVREVANGDLKGQLLRLLHATASKGSGDATQPLPAAKQALDAIEIQQTINTLAQATGGTFQLNLPLAGPAQWMTMQFAVQPDPTERDGEAPPGGRSSSGFNLLMHVDLDDLGDTWIDARVTGKNLSAVLYLESASGRDLARTQSAELKSALREAGFESILVDVRSTTELPEGRGGTQFESLRRTEPITPSLVDERA